MTKEVQNNKIPKGQHSQLTKKAVNILVRFKKEVRDQTVYFKEPQAQVHNLRIFLSCAEIEAKVMFRRFYFVEHYRQTRPIQS